MSSNSSRKLGLWTTVVLLFVAVAGSVHADCEWGDRIDMDDAECLTGEWQNRTWPDKDTASVKNECSTLGTVVAKVDRQGARDWTKWLEGDGTVNMSGAYGNVRGIYCCNDLSELCNKSDIVNQENCMARFKESPASEYPTTHRIRERRRCSALSATADPDDETCTLELSCSFWKDMGDTHRDVTETRQITASYVDVSRIVLSVDGQVSVP